MFSWRVKKQLFYFGIFAAIVFIVVFGLISLLRSSPTCFDKKQNQSEQGIDCGGPCQSCVFSAKEPIVLWSRLFETAQKGFYDAAALIENPNPNFKISSFKYRFKLYDEQNILVALKEGENFLSSGDKLLILERGLRAGERTPKRAGFEIISKIFESGQKQEIPVKIIDKKFSKQLFPEVKIILENTSLFPVENIALQIALLDESGNVYQVHKTKIDKIEGEARKSVVLTWPFDFKEPQNIEVYFQQIPRI